MKDSLVGEVNRANLTIMLSCSLNVVLRTLAKCLGRERLKRVSLH